jgi:carboxymethylenebutenolidase
MGFYGRPGAAQEVVDQMTAAVLILAAGADQATSPEDNAAFDRALTKAGKEHEYVIYEGAPHSFFDRSFINWASACDDAWARMLGFIDRRVGYDASTRS